MWPAVNGILLDEVEIYHQHWGLIISNMAWLDCTPSNATSALNVQIIEQNVS